MGGGVNNWEACVQKLRRAKLCLLFFSLNNTVLIMRKVCAGLRPRCHTLPPPRGRRQKGTFSVVLVQRINSLTFNLTILNTKLESSYNMLLNILINKLHFLVKEKDCSKRKICNNETLGIINNVQKRSRLLPTHVQQTRQ